LFSETSAADHRLDGDMTRLAQFVESGALSAHVTQG